MTEMFVSEHTLREYMSLNAPGTDSKYNGDIICSNILSAGWTLERLCNRLFGDVTKTMTFSTDGRAQVAIPGLRTATSVTLQGSALVDATSYWLLPDVQQTGVYTGIQVRAFSRPGVGSWWLGNPEWFDRNLDSPFYPGNMAGGSGALPNDLVIAGAWGYTEIPDPVELAVKALAAWYTLRPDALLSGVRQTPDGNIFDLSRYPTEVAEFVSGWRVGESAVLI